MGMQITYTYILKMEMYVTLNIEIVLLTTAKVHLIYDDIY